MSIVFNLNSIQFIELHKFTNNYNYSFISWKDGIRHSNNFIAAHALALDIDSGLTLEQAKQRVSEYKNVCIVTTRHHQQEMKNGKKIEKADRFRIIFLLDEPIQDVEIYKTVISNLINEYGGDTSCKDAARFFYGNQNQTWWYSNGC